MYEKEAERVKNLSLRQLAESNIRNAEERIGGLKRQIEIEEGVIEGEKGRLREAISYLRSIGETVTK